MAKKKSIFVCISCGNEYSKWLGKCPHCDEWNSIVESEAAPPKEHALKEAFSLSEVDFKNLDRIKTGIEEFNLVCGDGMVPGSVILIGGEPGIGKSTLALQIAESFKTLYISGEESPVQIRYRAERLGVNGSSIHVSSNTIVENIIKLIEAEKPECVIVDSVQTLYVSDVPGFVGSVSQIKESTSRLIEIAKRLNIPVVLIGHITKEGSIAGPKQLEHLVDTVLYFEGDNSREFRILRAFKNRFGSVNEIGLFTMTNRGLIEVKDKNSLFINPFSSDAPGNAISAALEGSRIILFEVQSLVTFTSFTNPRRMSDGFDLNRLILIIAVLEKHAQLKLNNFDVFINVAGGFQIDETSADLSVAMAIVSSLKNKAIPGGIGFLAEISLSGELRPVSQCQRRVQDFGRSGFQTVVLSKKDYKEVEHSGFKGDIVGLDCIAEAIDYIF
jgi:DNA repair protein RadA/Sms